ncbi:uncharacterized protein TNCV_3131171 [Trichonephila clavipes]|nr:uncharacterized protein TNCV_3131171 [Trichonephila clavipes]
MGIGDSTNICKDNWFTKYEKRSEELNDVSLSQFVAYYTVCDDGSYTKRKVPCIIRYCNYDMTQNLMEYKQEMVSLHIPFRNENADILAEMKFVNMNNNDKNVILQRRKEFESDLDIQKNIKYVVVCSVKMKVITPINKKLIKLPLNKIPLSIYTIIRM